MLRKASIVLVAVLMLLPMAAEAATAYEPPPGPKFNNPFGSRAARTRIFGQVIHAINHAPKGSTMQFAIYSFDRKSVADAMLRAHRRGVNVQMVLNDNWTSFQTRRLVRRLGHNPNHKNFVVICHGSCRGGYGNQHMKVYLFTQTGKAKNVVMTGSSNMTSYAAVNQWNDMFTVDNAAKMHALYAKIFDQLKYDRRVKHPFVVETTGAYQSMFYPHRGTTQANDPLMLRLNKIRCHAIGGTGVHGRSKIRIAVYGWTGRRGLYLARKVASLRHHGCNISVILSNGGGEVANRLKGAGIPVRSADYDYNHNGTLEKFTHEKWMTLSGTYAGHGVRRVWTGSENWSTLAPHNDEVTLRVDRGRAYRQYLQNFDLIWTRHSHEISKHYGAEMR